MRTEASQAKTAQNSSMPNTAEQETTTQSIDGPEASSAVPATEADILASEPPAPAPATVVRPAPPTLLRRRVRTMLQTLNLDEQWGRIILSVVLAILLWFYVTSLENPAQVTQFNGLAPEVRDLGSSLKVINTLPSVNITVQAPQNLLTTLRQTDVHPYVDLAQLGAGVHQVPVAIDVNDVADHSSMNFSVYPASVQVQLEVQATRVFSVGVEISGTPLQNYGAEPARVNPTQVQISGSEGAINRIARVVVAFDISNSTSTQSAYKSPVALDSTGQEISGLTFEPATVQVVVPINSLITTKLVPVHVPITGNPAPGYSASEIDLDPTNVTICCAPNNILTTISSLDTNPVSISSATSTVITSTQLILPAGVQLYPGQSSQISVTVQISTFETSWQLSVQPTVTNVAPQNTVALSPSSVNLTLSGTLAEFQSLKPGEITATLDASSLGPGTYDIEPKISVPQGVTLVSVDPARISVTLIPPTPLPPTPTATTAPIPTATVPAAVPASPTPLPSPTPTLAAPTPTETPTLAPTSTPLSATPTPTATLTPTHTLSPTATQLPSSTGTTTSEGSTATTPVASPPLPPGTPLPTATGLP